MAIAKVTVNELLWNEAVVPETATAVDASDGLEVVVSGTAIESTILKLNNTDDASATVVIKAGDGCMGNADDLSITIAAESSVYVIVDSKYHQASADGRIIKMTGPADITVEAFTKL